LGVGGKLQSAFSVVAGLTAVSTVVSLMSFSAVETGLGDFAGRQMPIVADVIQLSAMSGEISAAAARLINARTTDDQKKIAALIKHKRNDLGESLQRLQKLDSANPAVGKLLSLSQRLNANLSALEDIIAERTDLRTQIVTLVETLHRTDARLVERLLQFPDSGPALEVSARARLLVSLISEASTLREPTEFKRIQDFSEPRPTDCANRRPSWPITTSPRSPSSFCRSAPVPTASSRGTRAKLSSHRGPTPQSTKTLPSNATSMRRLQIW
jgi:hypothetical protein